MTSASNPSGMMNGALDQLMRIQAWRAVDATIEAGAKRYARMQHLPPLLRIWPGDLEGAEPVLTASILDRLRKALQQQRRKARQAGPGSKQTGYDVNRHIALLQAWRAECRLWRGMTKDLNVQSRNSTKKGSTCCPF
jgi:hypothetical protein